MKKSALIFFMFALPQVVFASGIFCLDAVAKDGGQKKLSQFEIELRDDPNTPWTNHVPESAYDHQGFVKSAKRVGINETNEMYYRIDYPRSPNGQEWIFLNHGLGDHSGRVNEIASRYLKDGYTVIRVDMLGHGRSLQKAIQTEGYDVDKPVTMLAQAVASHAVISQAKKLGAKKIRFIGHSLGGANVLKLASLLKTASFREPLVEVVGINLIDFYAQDLADWHATQAIIGRPITERVTDGIKFMSPEPMSKRIDKQYESGQFFFNQFFNVANAVLGFFGLNKVGETFTAPQLERFMYNSYEPYFRHYAEKLGIDLNDPKVKESLDIQIRSAIAVTRGARSFNLFHPSEDLPHSKVPIQILAAVKDELVPIAMMKQAALRLVELGFHVDFVEIEDAGHLVTRTHPDAVYQRLRQAPAGQPVQ